MNYKLELSKNIRIYPIFYISLLESVDSEILIITKKLLRLIHSDKYKIKTIIRYNLKIYRYIVKWKRYPKKENL